MINENIKELELEIDDATWTAKLTITLNSADEGCLMFCRDAEQKIVMIIPARKNGCVRPSCSDFFYDIGKILRLGERFARNLDWGLYKDLDSGKMLFKATEFRKRCPKCLSDQPTHGCDDCSNYSEEDLAYIAEDAIPHLKTAADILLDCEKAAFIGTQFRQAQDGSKPDGQPRGPQKFIEETKGYVVQALENTERISAMKNYPARKKK